MLLENDPRNPCIGCGPEHPMGLRLAFRREGDAVLTTLVADARLQGWPERLHSGILYLAMLETANWALFGLLGRAGVPSRTSALSGARLVRVGESLTLTGRLGGEARVLVEARDEAGAVVATLEREYELPTRAEFLARMGYASPPAGLEEAFPE